MAASSIDFYSCSSSVNFSKFEVENLIFSSSRSSPVKVSSLFKFEFKSSIENFNFFQRRRLAGIPYLLIFETEKACWQPK